jgi:hypothetical protein
LGELLSGVTLKHSNTQIYRKKSGKRDRERVEKNGTKK